MKKFTLSILAVLFIVLNLSAQNQQIIVGKNYQNPNEITLVAERGTSTTIKFDLNELNLTEVETNYGKANVMLSGKAPVIIEKGVPELIYLPTAIIIPDIGSAELDIVYGEFTEIKNVEIAPSKGSIPRTIDPATVPYEKGEVYGKNAFFPGTLAQINETFIMRDVRGATIFTYPVQYNPVTKVLRIYSEITITVNYTETKGENEFTTQKRHETIDPEFKAMYERMFINHSVVQQRGYPTGEEGELLIICAPAFLTDMQPYVDWKRTIGRKTTLVSTATAGTTSTAIKTYITNYYNANNLSHVLLVGDKTSLPPVGTSNPRSDIKYGQIVSGNYLDVLVGRFSATTSEHVQTQVQKAIWYERDTKTTDTWMTNAMGIGVNENNAGPNINGGHDGSENDYRHIENIRGRLLTYGYTTVYQEYFNNCPGYTNSSTTLMSQHFNSGVSMTNYCNHGSPTAWTPSGGADYTNSLVDALTNVKKLPFIFSVACNNGEFGAWQYNSSGAVCFAETWLRANNGGLTGAIAFLGATISIAWTETMTAQDEFVDLCLGITHTAGGFNYGIPGKTIKTISGAMLNATQRMLQRHGPGCLNDYNSWTVFGDPTLMFRTKTPQAMTVTHNPSILPTETSISVTCVEGALAALTYTNASNEVIILGTAVAGTNNIAVINYTLPSPAPENVKLAVTGFNKVTYTATIPVTTFQPQFCEKPNNVQGSANGNNATITWTVPTNIDGVLTGYYIYRDETKIGEVSSTTMQYTDAGRPNGTYIYKVSAKYQHCESPQTDGTSVTIFVPIYCEKPNNVQGSANENTATITWSKPTNIDGVLTSYYIYRDGEKIGTTLSTVTQYVDAGRPNGTYIYKVSAKYQHCESPQTDGTTVTIFVPIYCEKPLSVEGSANGNTATITWAHPTHIDGVLTGYWIYRNETKIGETLPTVTQYTDAGRPNGTYVYQIKAIYQHCESELSEGATVVISASQLCETPIDVMAVIHDCGAVITWKKPETDEVIIEYEIYRNGILLTSQETNSIEIIFEPEPYTVFDTTFVIQIKAVYEQCKSELTDEVPVVISCGPKYCEPPVELTVINEAKDAVLSWKVPVNIDGLLLGYNIYRNDVQINNDNLVVEPKYRDEKLDDGTYIYQISSVYLHCDESEKSDGASITIITKSINNLTNSFNIYPNPTIGKFEIQSSKFKVQSVEIFDMLGRKIPLQFIEGVDGAAGRGSKVGWQPQADGVVMDISNLSNGVYFLKIETEEGTVVKKVTKN